MSRIIITCDPEFDLHAAGKSIEEADDFYDAWESAALALGAAISDDLDLHVARCHGAGEDTSHEDEEGESFETSLWQAAHDMVYRRKDGRWATTEPQSHVVRGLRRFAQRLDILPADVEE